MAIAKVVVRQAFAYDSDKVSEDNGLSCPEETLAVQADKDECDINVLVKRFGLTGEMPVGLRPIMQGDFTGIGTYQEALERLDAADEQFMSLPAEVRKRFDHDPGAFVDFCSNPANIKELQELGLADKPAPAEVNAAASAAAASSASSGT